jgi:hypothetical protein
MSPRPPIPHARTREPDRSDPAADGIGHRLTGGATPAGRIARPSADSGSLGAPAGTGGRAPSRGSWDPIARGFLWRTNGEGRATPNIRSQDLSGLQVMPYSPSPCVPQFHRPSVQAHPPGYSRQYPGVKVAPLVG